MMVFAIEPDTLPQGNEAFGFGRAAMTSDIFGSLRNESFGGHGVFEADIFVRIMLDTL